MDKSTVMHIRVPAGLATQLKNLSEEEGLSLGSALKCLIEDSQNRKIEGKIDGIYRRLLFLEASQIINDISTYEVIHQLEGEKVKKLSPGQLTQLRQAKANLEELGVVNDVWYKYTCAELYSFGKEKRDKNPKMKKIHDEYLGSLKNHIK